MAKLHILAIIALSSLLSVVVQPQAPSPGPVVAHVPPPPLSPTPTVSPSPLSAPTISPPAPPQSPPSPESSPSPSPSPSADVSPPLPSPSPPPPSTVGSKNSNASANDESKESQGGLTKGQKAGAALGTIAAVCIVALAAILYRKRQQNIQRSQYGYAARSEML
ncbi:hypothetical protein RHGRI_036509 [Rhododendron griersonianum]|uniref:Uncharacterized protein n=1 Tax=Rhododendron griersonianum TaxID=479676 RepID=A0AAV6HSF3_9ERIC|nr:hypothetical protein RHGRI_036509 [Rhododendron griersonianum]